MSDENRIRFYFSFRSPYAWMATEKLEAELGDLDVEIEPDWSLSHAACAAATAEGKGLAFALEVFRKRWSEGANAWDRAVSEDGIFGVPSFIYRGKLYWGQDRMHFVREAVQHAAG
ncbi:MAG: hypothetical protein QF570_19655 [Myxococcota bacterium]|nr:hypothetical protein [Myxococcota bacterium]